MPSSLLIGAAQLHSPYEPAECAAQCIAIIAEAEAEGVDLLILPESASSRTDAPGTAPQAQQLDGPFVRALLHALQDSTMTVIAGMTEESEARPFNTVVALDSSGVRSIYRKLHLYDAAGMRESDTVRPGDKAPPVIDVKGFGVGIMTCYDIRFPEISRVLALRGADIIAVPTSWVHGPLKESHWLTFTAARALESTSYVVGAAQTGGSRIGRTVIVSPDGVAIAAAGSESTLLLGRVYRDRITSARTAFPLLEQRRFEVSQDPLPAPTGIGVAPR